MTRTPFSRRRFLQLSGGLALAGVSLPLWAHDMADMAGGDTHPALRLPQPYKIKLAINKSAVCLAPVAVAEQQKIFSKYNLDVEFVNFGNSTDVLLEAIATGKADAGVGMALRWLKALEQGFDVKLTAGTHGGCLNLLTAKDSPFGGLESLKGQTIGVTDMAGPDKTSSPFCLSATVSTRSATCSGKSTRRICSAWRWTSAKSPPSAAASRSAIVYWRPASIS